MVRASFLLLFFLFVCCAVPLYQRNVLGGMFTNFGRILDPKKLRVAQLEAILQTRGVHGNYVEKREMVAQVKNTGITVLEDLEEYKYVGALDAPMYIQGESEFSRHVEAYGEEKTSWLIRILYTNGYRSKKEDKIWKRVEPKMALLGLKIAYLECRHSDKRLCPKWRKAEAGLVLVTQNPLGKQSMFHTPFPRSEADLHEWVYEQLNPIVKRIDAETLTNVLTQEPGDRVLFVTDSNTRPPLFFLVLSARFAGHIPFVFISNFVNSSIGSLPITHFPAYVVLAPGHQLEFGLRCGEQLSFESMEAFLLNIQLDSVLCTCYLVLIGLTGLHFFLFGQIKMGKFIVLVGTCGLVLKWLHQLDLLEGWIQNVILPSSLYLEVSFSDSVGLFRLAVRHWKAHPIAFCAVFLGTCLLRLWSVPWPMSSQQDQRSPSPQQNRRTPSPQQNRRTPSPQQNRRTPSPQRQNRRPPSPQRQNRRPPSPQQGRWPLLEDRLPFLLHRRLEGFHQQLLRNQIDHRNISFIEQQLAGLQLPNVQVPSLYLDRVQLESRPAESPEFNYSQCLKVWKWPRHVLGCPKSEETAVVDNACSCINHTKDSSCTSIVSTWGSGTPNDVVPDGVDLANYCCIFCQCPFCYKDTLGTLPCHHTFHLNGIYKWLADQSNKHQCPVCRKSCRE